MAYNLKNLDFKTAGFWPEPMKIAAYAIAFVAVLGLSWLLWFSSEFDELHKLDSQESDLREEYKKTQLKANNLENLKEELAQINDLIKTLVTRLPNKNEIPELVVDVSQAALANGLQTDLFEPQDENKHEFYAEKQINVKFRGGYHQLGSFFSEVAKQPRLVSVVIDDMTLEVAKDNSKDQAKPSDKTPGATTKLVDMTSTPLAFSGTVRTYRYLSEDEEEEQAKLAAAAEAEKAKKDKKAKNKPEAPKTDDKEK